MNTKHVILFGTFCSSNWSQKTLPEWLLRREKNSSFYKFYKTLKNNSVITLSKSVFASALINWQFFCWFSKRFSSFFSVSQNVFKPISPFLKINENQLEKWFFIYNTDFLFFSVFSLLNWFPFFANENRFEKWFFIFLTDFLFFGVFSIFRMISPFLNKWKSVWKVIFHFLNWFPHFKWFFSF